MIDVRRRRHSVAVCYSKKVLMSLILLSTKCFNVVKVQKLSLKFKQLYHFSGDIKSNPIVTGV